MESSKKHADWQERIRQALAEQARPDTFRTRPLDELVGEISVYHQELEYQNEELRRAQEALAASREHYVSLFQDAPVAYVVVDQAYQIQAANQQFTRLTGTSDQAVRGTLFQEWVAPESQDALHFHFHRLTQSRTEDETQVKMINTAGARMVQLHSRWITESGRPQIRISLTDITEQTQSEAKLAAANQRLLTVLNSIDGLIFVADMETDEILYVNPALENLYGDITGRPCWEALHDGAGSPCPHCHKDKLVNASGLPTEPQSWQYYNQKVARWYDCRDTALRWIDGRIVHLQIAWDITERMQTAEQLRQSEEQFRGIVENMTEGLVIHDFSGTILSVNDNTCRFLGYEREELLGAKIADIHSPLEQNMITARSQTLLDQGHLVFEAQLLGKDGSPRSFDVSAKVVDYEGAGLVQALARDTSQRREAEEVLKRFRIALDSSPDSVFIIHRDSMRFVDVNATGCQSLGYALDELLAIGPQDIKPDYSREALAERFDAILASSEQADVIQTLHRRRDGSTFPVEIFLKGFQSNEGAMIIASVRDITERIEAEAKLNEYTYSLEQEQEKTEALNHQLNEEFRRAQVIHQSVLPQVLPEVPGLELSAYFQPAALVGGDFYNVVHSRDKLIFYVSDVTGHGLEGALVSVFFKEAISGYLELGPETIEPEGILQHVYRQYRKNAYPADYFIACFLAVLDLSNFQLRFAGAGFQESMLVRLKDGTSAAHHVSGLPLSNSIDPDLMVFRSNAITLQPGCTVLVNTDGLTEQRVDDEDFFPRRQMVFQQYSHLPPAFLQQAINREFRTFNRGSLQGGDDITYLILQRQPTLEQERVLQLRSDFGELQRLDAEVADLVSTYPHGEQFFESLRELAANAIEHGNQFDRNKYVTVVLRVTSSHLLATVADEGAGFAWYERVYRPVDLRGLSDRGRGIALTSIACHQLVYNETGTQAIIALAR